MLRYLSPILRHGRVPQHIAFIMDGNRRYARAHSLATPSGHAHGFQALESLLDFCFHLGIQCITVYAFSIENFKRNKEEVDGLMQLAQEKLAFLCDQSELMRKHRVRIRVLGRLELLPEQLQCVIQRVHAITQDHSGATLNLCMPYTARDELLQSIQRIHPNDYLAATYPFSSLFRLFILSMNRMTDVEVLERHLMTAKSPNVDLLIRTSGERRLSDFLLYQVTQSPARIYFIQKCWPEFSPWDLFWILLEYQYTR